MFSVAFHGSLKTHQIASGGILIHAMVAAQRGVNEETQLGDIVDLDQKVDLKDDLQEVVIHLLVALFFSAISLKFYFDIINNKSEL